MKVEIPITGDGFSFRKLFAFMGPGILISIAYMDPGNCMNSLRCFRLLEQVATDIQAGASFNYRMIWVLVFATTLGLFLQVLCSRLGLITGFPKTLSEIIYSLRERFSSSM